MSTELELMEFIKKIIIEKGTKGTRKAIEEILQVQSRKGDISMALEYLTQVTVPAGLPIFPALLSLSNEAAGGDAEKTVGVGAAIAMITWAADIHDDVIDQSTVKYSNKTVYGKFGAAMAILAGDALLIQGSTLLENECDSLDKERRKQILDLTLDATLEIGEAEAEELLLVKNHKATPQQYCELVRSKAVVPESICKIGALLANANQKTVGILGCFGRAFGIASTYRDEFADLMELPELKNRLTNEIPPLPMLYAMQNPELKEKIMPLLENPNLPSRQTNKIAKTILKSKEAQSLRQELDSIINKGLEDLKGLRNNKVEKEITSLLIATRVGI
jgi:geranylgeranyl pyrophosphate synthase